MTRFLIFLFPAMMDIIVGLLLFVIPIRITQESDLATLMTAATSTWAISYLLANHFIGLWTNTHNAAWLIISAGISMAIISGCFVIFPGIVMMFVLTFMAGISTALFFAPFQYFMKIVGGEHNAGVVRSTALYTFSWSAGMALGPFLSGYILQYHNWKWCMALNALLATTTAVGIYFLKHHAQTHPAEHDATLPEPQPEAENSSYAKMPDLVKMGWIGAGMGIFVVLLIRALFINTAKLNALDDFQAGMVLFLLSGSQALGGLSLIFSRTWMYKTLPVCAYGCLGIVATVMFGAMHTTYGFYAAAVIFGVYSGALFFYFVFHSLVHPQRAGRYVSINEMVVGACGIVGPLFGGVLSDKISPSSPYFVSAVIIIASLAYQARVYAKMRTKINAVLTQLPAAKNLKSE